MKFSSDYFKVTRLEFSIKMGINNNKNNVMTKWWKMANKSTGVVIRAQEKKSFCFY